MLIRVRTKDGRVATTAPAGGKAITHDAVGTLVERTTWIDRLLTVHGDIEVVEQKAAPAPALKKPVAIETDIKN